MERRWWLQNVAQTYPEPGDTFLAGSMPEANQWTDVCVGYPGGRPRFVAVSNTGAIARAAYSDDGITFAAATINLATAWGAVCWSETDGLYYAAGANSIATSPDGVTFTDLVGTFPAVTYRDIAPAFGAPNYLVITHDAGIVRTTDGVTFTDAAIGTQNRKPGYNPDSGRYACINLGGVSQRASYSDDAAAWTPVDTPTPESNWRGLSYSSRLGLWVACGGINQLYMYSDDDAESWTVGTAPNGNNNSSIVWADELRKFVSVASSGAGVRGAMSRDGMTFAEITTIPASSWQAICWAPTVGYRGRFVAVSFNGISCYSGT